MHKKEKDTELLPCLKNALDNIINMTDVETIETVAQNDEDETDRKVFQFDNITGDTELRDLERYSMELFKGDLESKTTAISDQVLFCNVANLIVEYRKHHSLNLSLEHINLIKNATVWRMQQLLLNTPLKDIEKYSLLEFFGWLNFDFNSIAAELRDTLTERELFIVQNREKKTLYEIGNCLNITRERVRQIEAKIERKLIANKQYTLGELMRIVSIIVNKPAISFPELSEICGEQLGKILWNLYVIRKNDGIFGYKYDKQLNMIILATEEKSHIGTSLLAKINKLDSLIESSDMRNFVYLTANEEGTSEELVWKCINNIYKNCGTVYYNSHLTKTQATDFILYKYFKDGYKIADEQSSMNLKTKLEELFDFEINSQHAVDAIVSKIAILSDRGMYMHPSYITYNEQLIDEIIEYINNSPRTVIMYMELYDEFYQQLIDNNINNKDMLHGILKLHCAKMTDIGFTLHKDYIAKAENTNFVSEFTNFVKANGPVTKKDMQEYFVGLKPINIELLLSQCREIVDMHNKYFVHSSTLKILHEDYTQLETYLLQKCKYIPKTAEDLYYDIYYKFEEFVSRNAINSPEKLYGILEYMFKNGSNGLKFSRGRVSIK